MKLKRFVASDSAKAMRMIKDTFGPDAVILSSHSVEDGVEVVAAIDYDESVMSAQVAEQTVISQAAQSPGGNDQVISPLDDVRQEIQTLRSMIEAQLLTTNQFKAPLHQVLSFNLSRQGFSQSIIELLLRNTPSTLSQSKAWQSLLHQLQQKMIIYPGRRIEESGTYAFVGPTGVGKTTTLAKLAARFSLRYGAGKLGLVTTDAYRIAAHEQLMTYGKILGVNVCMAEDEHSLTRTLQKLADKKLILIDTAGMNPSDERVAEQMQMLNQQSAISKVMVMSATSQYEVINQIMKAYQSYCVDQCIVTKLDEAVGVGAVISAHIEHNVPLSYITNGQRVPEDIKLAVKDSLINKLMEDNALFRDEQDISIRSRLSLQGESYV